VQKKSELQNYRM